MALTKPFCENGNKVTIPETTVDGSVSYDQGFGAFYALPPEEGGLFIDRAQFNQLMYDTTSQVIANKTAIATKANANATVNLTGNQTINGTKTFNNNITAPNITTMQNNLNTIFNSTTSPVKTQTTTKIITVGTGGDFTTIPQAVAEAIKYTSSVQIKLISNITTTKNINIENVSGHHITINFNNFKIINSDSNTASFFNIDNSSIAVIDFLNLEGYELRVSNASSTMLRNNVRITAGSRAGSRAIAVNNASSISAYSNITYTIQGSSNISPFFCEDNSILTFGNLNSIVDTTGAGALFVAATGGIINLTNLTSIQTTCTATANIAANTITPNGIIFGNYSL